MIQVGDLVNVAGVDATGGVVAVVFEDGRYNVVFDGGKHGTFSPDQVTIAHTEDELRMATDGVWLNSVRTEEREEEVETQLIRNVPKGEYIRFTVNGPVYVRDDYDRETKTFSCYKFSDVNSFRNVKGDKSVFVGFTF